MSDLRGKILEYVLGSCDFFALVTCARDGTDDWWADPHGAAADLYAAVEMCDSDLEYGVMTEGDARQYLRTTLEEHNVTFHGGENGWTYSYGIDDWPTRTVTTASAVTTCAEVQL